MSGAFGELITDTNLLELGHIPLILLPWIHARIVRTRNLIFLGACPDISIVLGLRSLTFPLDMGRYEHGIRVLCALVRVVSDRFATFLVKVFGVARTKG